MFKLITILLISLLVISVFSFFIKRGSRNGDYSKRTNGYSTFGSGELNYYRQQWSLMEKRNVVIEYYVYNETFNSQPFNSSFYFTEKYLTEHLNAKKQEAKNIKNNLLFDQKKLTNILEQLEGNIMDLIWRMKIQSMLNFDASQTFASLYKDYKKLLEKYFIKGIMIAEIGKGMNHDPKKIINHDNYDDFISQCFNNFLEEAQKLDEIYKDLLINWFYGKNKNQDNHSKRYTNYSEFKNQGNDILNKAYKTLGVNEKDDNNTIKRAYRALAKKYHPDKNASKEAVEKMAQINAAYNLIKEKRNQK